MTKTALLLAAGFLAAAPSMASAAGAPSGYPQPCCQDTIKLFWLGADTFWKPNTWKPYTPPAPVRYSPPQPCCQDTVKLFWLGADTWDQPPKGGWKRW
jgi:hypothetical protein